MLHGAMGVFAKCAAPLRDKKRDRGDKIMNARRHLVREHEPQRPLSQFLIAGNRRNCRRVFHKSSITHR